MGVSFLKKGKDAQKALAEEEAKAELRQKQKASRFWLPKNKDARITFLDGVLDEDGVLDVPVYHEHQLHMNGHWRNWFVCTKDDEPCPICEQGDASSFVGALSVIDHSEFKDSQGNVRKDEVRLFIAKRETLARLQKIASKREGLAGCTFDVSRVGEKAANVGDTFDFDKKEDVAKVMAKYNVEPYDYQEVLGYRTADELRQLGFGQGGMGVAASGAANPEEDL